MNHFNYNGKLYAANTPIIGADNRGLRYGDGLFETMKYCNGNILLADDHFARLWKGMQAMKFDIPKLFTPEWLAVQVEQLLKKNKHAQARIRLSIFRGNGGLYDPENNQPNWLLQSWALPADKWRMNENGLQLTIYRDALKICDAFSNLKHNNYLPYLLAAQYGKSIQCNDAVVLNQHRRVCDSTIANIFCVQEGKIYTPALDEGCVAGVMRKWLIKALPAIGYEVIETSITEDFLLGCSEVFLSNSMYNIRWVAGIAEKAFGNSITRKIALQLQQTNAAVIC